MGVPSVCIRMNIVFDHSVWYLIPAIATGAVYAILLYYRNKNQQFSKSEIRWLFVLRFVLVSLLTMLLLHPNIRQQKKLVEPPIIVVAHDNSESMVMGPDSLLLKQLMPARFDSLIALLSTDYRVDSYTFDKEAVLSDNLNFTGYRTDISSLFANLQTAYYNRNLAAIVVLTDGINNHGIPPDLMAGIRKTPVYTIGTGDTVIRPDVSITDLRHNKIVFQETSFPVELTVKAQKADGRVLHITLFMGSEKIDEAVVTASGDSYSHSLIFKVDATESGRKKLTAIVEPIEGEQNQANNQWQSYVDILQDQSEILILARAPHPDIAAIRSVIDDQHKISVQYITEWKAVETKKYNLLILHDLPALDMPTASLESFLTEYPDLPIWVIIGPKTELSVLNRFNSGIQFSDRSTGLIDILPIIEPNFSLFSIESFRHERIMRFPALITPLLEINLPLNHTSLLYQRIRGVATSYPMLGFMEDANRRMAYLTGTGLWRWRIADYSQNGNHETFHELISKTMTYLMVKTDTRPLRIMAEASYLTQDDIGFRAELYNPSMEMVNEPDLHLNIIHEEEGTSYDYVFSRSDHAYQLHLGKLPAGSYTYTAETVLGGKKLSTEGDFVIISSTIESQELVANHELLRRLASQSGGRFLKYPDWKQIQPLIHQDQRIASTVSFTQNYSPLITKWWLPCLLLLLITVEWLLRKASGNY